MPLHVAMWAATDIGRARMRNEDAFLLDPGLGLAVVTDGVGGLLRGDVASTLACRAVREHVGRYPAEIAAFRADPVLVRRSRIIDVVRDAVQLANAEVWRAGQALAPGRGMACTLEMALIIGDTAFLAHVGDARTYLARDGAQLQLTDDHTVGRERVLKGLARPGERPGKGHAALTRAVGVLPTVRVDTLVLPLEVGDRLLLCTDGLHKYLMGEEVVSFTETGDAWAADALVRLALERGGNDNITVGLLSVSATAPVAGVTAVQLDELRTTALFENVTSHELRAIAAVSEWREVRAGRMLFREGEAVDALYVVVGGEVAVMSASGVHLDTVRRGGALGEMGIFDGLPRSAGAVVTRDARLVVVPKARIEQLMRQDDALAARIGLSMAKRMAAVIRANNLRLKQD